LFGLALGGAVMLLASCAVLGPGYIGPIQPPVLDIPVMVSDLRAVEYGGQIIAFFTIPKLSTEGQTLKSLRAINLYAGPSAGSDNPDAWARSATRYSVPAPGGSTMLIPGPYEYHLPAQAWIGKDVVVRVRSTGPKGKQSIWSLPLALNVTAPIPQPTGVMAESRKDGVHLSWKGSGPKYRVMRSVGTAMPEAIGDTDKPEFVDGSAQFGTTYRYLVLAFADDKHQSLISAPTEPLTPIDVFPPEVPTGLTAEPGVNAIELEWELNTEADFKGYNVYRSVDNGPYVKIASLITAATYHDTNVQTGKVYRYQVSAVDLANNESERCAPVAAMLQ
jgi:hypothetical protein